MHQRCLGGATESSAGDRLERADGRIQWIAWEARPWTDKDGAVGGIVISSQDVTECVAAKKQAEDAARFAEAAERRLKDVIDAIPLGFDLYDADDRLVVSNAAAEAMYPHTAVARRPGITFENLLRIGVERRIHGPSESVNEDWLRERMERHCNPCGPWDQLTVDGQWLRIEECRLSDGGVVVVRSDVTDIKTRERELAEKTSLIEATLHNMGEGLAAFDADRNLVIANDFAVRMVNLPPALGRPGVLYEDILRFLAEVIEPDVDVETFVALWVAQFLAQQPFQTTGRLKDGRTIEARFNPTPGGGGVFIYRDVTERVANEAKLAEETALLETTLENMGEGIAVFGPDLKLRMFNKVAKQLLAAPAALARLGTDFEDVVRLRAGQGDFGDVDVNARVRDAVALFRGQRHWVRTDVGRNGRVTEARFDPLPDGGGVFVLREVTDAAAAEKALTEKSALLEVTLENIGEAVAVYGADLRLRIRNDLATRLLDTPSGLFEPGAALQDIYRFRIARGDYGDVAADEFVRERLERFNSTGSSSRTVSSSGARMIESRFNPLPDGGGIYVFGDVTERERAQSRILEEEAKFRSLVEQNVAGIVIVREDGTMGYCNGYFARMLGYAPSEIIGRPLLDLVSEADHAVIGRSVRALFVGDGAPVQIASTARARDGKAVEVLVNASKARFEGRTAGIAVVVDVTERKAAELALRAAMAESDRANRAKSTFLAAASHDLRQPVQSLTLLLSVIKRHVAEQPKAASAVRMADAALYSLSGLLNGILDLSKLDAGLVTPVAGSVDLAELTERLVSEYQPRAVDKGLSLRVARHQLNVSADLEMLEQILRNLLENALRYTRKGGVLLAVRRRGETVRLDVIDTGIGIAADKLTEIFEEFRQLDNPARDSSRGLGLGLAIASRLARLLGTEVRVASRPGHGSRFSLVLPLDHDGPPAVGDELTLDDASGRVLLIEDNANLRQTYEMTLADWGYATLAAATGEEALHLAEREEWRFDAVIADHRLGPGLTGVEVAMEIARRATRDIPTMIVTGDVAKERIAEILASGFVVIHKPVEAAELRQHLAKALGVKTRNAASGE